MSDNWSAFTSLATQGDFIEWSFTLDATSADLMNGIGSPPLGRYFSLNVRSAFTTAAPNASNSTLLVCINDWVQIIIAVAWSEAPYWDSAGRFAYHGYDGISNYNAVPYVTVDVGTNVAQIDASPTRQVWVTGTNTIRVVNIHSGLQLDIDNVEILVGAWRTFVGDDQTVETVPGTYAAWTNGTSGTWILKAPDGTTGSYVADPTITVEKACKITATDYVYKIHVHDGGTDMAGEVGLAGGSPTRTILDRKTLIGGRATLEANATFADAVLWYGGDANYAPELVTDPIVSLGCGGWHLGVIGMSA